MTVNEMTDNAWLSCQIMKNALKVLHKLVPLVRPLVRAMSSSNPYKSPGTGVSRLIPKRINFTFVTIGFGLLPIVGAVIGFGGCIFAAFMLETRNTATEAILSYGQQFGLISLPIAQCSVLPSGLGSLFPLLANTTFQL